jgi:hypothetical protein
VGLPLNTNASPDEVADVVFSSIVQPVIQAAIAKGEIHENAVPDKHFLLDSAFVIPSKKGASPSAIVKLSSQNVWNLVFRHKKDALPKELHPVSRKERCKFAIYEDLSPTSWETMPCCALLLMTLE